MNEDVDDNPIFVGDYVHPASMADVQYLRDHNVLTHNQGMERFLKVHSVGGGFIHVLNLDGEPCVGYTYRFRLASTTVDTTKAMSSKIQRALNL